MINTCVNSLVSTIENFANGRKENFNGASGVLPSEYKGQNFIVVLITFLIIILIISLVGQFLWNYVMSGNNALIGGCNKAKNIWQILALYFLVALFLGR